ncbi:amino acid transporter [Mycobacterium sp. MAA66]|uniref:APC family permease n=1 Tax=Mycobacterium sp. MAA66 TaxID=3156297 RepID=UPI0035178924
MAIDPSAENHSDAAILTNYGYTQELDRGLKFWTTWAIGFAMVSPIVGLYTIVALGATAAGPAWVWAIPLVAVGQMALAMVYAQLAAKWPLSGGIYQWTRRLLGPAASWWAGWFYLWAVILTVAGVTYSGGQFLGELFGIQNPSPLTSILLAMALLVVVTVINSIGLNVLKYAVLIGICAELVGSIAVGLSLLIVARKQPLGVLVDTSLAPGGSSAFVGAFVAAIAVAGWAFIGFDACGSVAEETQNPRREVPRAIVWSLPPVILVVIIGAVALMLSTPDMSAVVNGLIADPVGNSVGVGLGAWAEKPFLAVVVIGFTACALAVQTTASRVAFSFARDGMIPGSSLLRKVSGHNRIPVVATLTVGGLAALAFLYSDALNILVKFSTGAYFIAFLFPAVALLYVRVKGQWVPYPQAPFGGRFGYAVNIFAVVWALFECINIAWPRHDVTPAATWAVPAGLAVCALVGGLYFVARRPDRAVVDTDGVGGSEVLPATAAPVYD